MTKSMNNNLVLSLDPASEITGYAVTEPTSDLYRPTLHEAGRLKGSERRMTIADPVLSQLMNCDAMRAHRRIASICRDVVELMTRWLPAVIVVEVPSGLPGYGSKRGAGASLTTYGCAAGEVLRIVSACVTDTAVRMAGYQPLVVQVTERIWTPFRKSKAGGQLACQALYPGQYRPADDEGADISDAIHLGRWWIWWREQPEAFRAAKLKAAKEKSRSFRGDFERRVKS